MAGTSIRGGGGGWGTGGSHIERPGGGNCALAALMAQSKTPPIIKDRFISYMS
jgi:hypothetical protein